LTCTTSRELRAFTRTSIILDAVRVIEVIRGEFLAVASSAAFSELPTYPKNHWQIQIVLDMMRTKTCPILGREVCNG